MKGCKRFFVRRSARAAVVFAFGTVLMCAGSAWAVDCTQKEQEPAIDASPQLQWGGATVDGNPLAANDRQKIEDLLSRYAWALDQRDEDRFADLFVDTGRYEVCTGEGSIQLYVAASKDEIRMMMQQQFDATKELFQPRHVLANTLLRNNKDGKDLDSKSTMAVTIQRSDGDRVLPETDYTADVRATLQIDSGVWKFATVTVYADTPEFEAMGR